MASIKNNSQLYFIILVFLAFLYSCEEQGRWSKEWEEKFETFQPSNKIMDVIGIQAGMQVGEIGADNERFAVKVAAIDTSFAYDNVYIFKLQELTQ